ncbi:MAG: DUF4388 domain-containing protein [candidate division Zixibacteria bacterium]|nr:DUF4388 domain-containing protein [candidate division Zixibacteria bacterium]
MSFTGNLQTVAFPDLLQLFSAGKKTGTVTIIRGNIRKEIVFKEGNIISASSQDAEEDYLGQIVLKSGRITKTDLQRAVYMHKTSGKKIGQVLVEMKLLNREELGLLLKQQVEEIIYNLFSWKEGEFIFKEGQLPASREGLVELNTMNIIMEGTRRIDEWVEIQKVMPSDHQILRVAGTPQIKSDEVTISLDEFRVLTLIDGTRTVQDILSQSPLGDFATSRAVYKLLLGKLVEVAGAKEAEVADPREEDSLFWLLLRVYAAAFSTVQRTLEKKLGTENEKVQVTLANFRKGIWQYFNGVSHADFPTNFEALKRALAKTPKETRTLKLISGLNQILEEQLAYVYNYLGIEIRKQVAADIKKEIALPLAERREIDKKYDVGNELYRILKEVKVTKEVL